MSTKIEVVRQCIVTSILSWLDLEDEKNYGNAMKESLHAILLIEVTVISISKSVTSKYVCMTIIL